jgi:hypothetical protein
MQAGKNYPNGPMLCFDECSGEQDDSPVSFLRKKYMAFLGLIFFYCKFYQIEKKLVRNRIMIGTGFCKAWIRIRFRPANQVQ